MGAWLEGQRYWLAVECLPGYAHHLDPVEGLAYTPGPSHRAITSVRADVQAVERTESSC